uniref:Uncharacterized protein n=1 Tax=Fagus sylvatica TaxID=28930 RepID=A0A2N9IQC8_FAGSY
MELGRLVGESQPARRSLDGADRVEAEMGLAEPRQIGSGRGADCFRPRRADRTETADQAGGGADRGPRWVVEEQSGPSWAVWAEDGLTEPRWADRARRSYTGPRRGSSMLRWLEGAEIGRGGPDRG